MSEEYRWVDPQDDPTWNERLLESEGSTFFHSGSWARILSLAYGRRPNYLVGPGAASVVPLMEVSSWLTGRRGVSLPFSDMCPPILNGGTTWEQMVPLILKRGRERKWKSVEFRDARPPQPGAERSAQFYGHTLALGSQEGALADGLSSNTRRNIRKAEREGVTVEISHSQEAMREFYRLNVLTRKMHGLPPQPYSFFTHIHEQAVSQGMGSVVLAHLGDDTIAGAVYFEWGRHAYYKYGASDRRYQDARANHLVMWQAITTFAERGFDTLCFGRTEPWNEGLRRFKKGWGAEEGTMDYYKYDFPSDAFVVSPLKIQGPHNAIFRRMPRPLLRLTGALLYPHAH